MSQEETGKAFVENLTRLGAEDRAAIRERINRLLAARRGESQNGPGGRQLADPPPQGSRGGLLGGKK